MLSVKSDDSDADSECFVVINQAVHDDLARDLFAINSKRASPVEIASEAVEDVAASVSFDLVGQKAHNEPLASKEGVVRLIKVLFKGILFKQLHFFLLQISVATFHLGRLQLAQQSIGSQACIKVQAASLSGEECPAISWEDFQVLLIS